MEDGKPGPAELPCLVARQEDDLVKMPTLPRAVMVGAAVCVLVGLVCLPGCLSFTHIENPARVILASGADACVNAVVCYGCGPAPETTPTRCGLAIPEPDHTDDLALLPCSVTGFVSV